MPRSISINEDALALLRSLVLHVATGRPLTEVERQAVRTMATLLGAPMDDAQTPLELDAVDADGRRIDCNGECEFDLPQIGTTIWLVAHLMRLGGDVDKKRRRVARQLVDYFESRRQVLGLALDQPILYQYLHYMPSLRERSEYMTEGWLPEQLLRTTPDIETMVLDRLYPSVKARLTLYKICYWFAVASGRRHSAVIDGLAQIRSELALERDDRCLGISAAIAGKIGVLPQPAREPDKTQPLALALASRVVAGTFIDDTTLEEAQDVAERLVALIPEIDRLPALAVVFDVAMRETQLSPASLGGIARVVEAIDPSEGELTGLLLRHELDLGRRIRLQRAYRLDYGQQPTQLKHGAKQAQKRT